MQKIIRILPALLLILSFILFPANVLAGEEKISFMYLHGGKTQDYINQFQLAKGSVDIISPNYFELDNQGNLVINADNILTNYMHGQKVKVVPYLSNHWNREIAQTALKNPEKLAHDLAVAADIYNVDGINIDLENLTYEDRAQLTKFAGLLKNKLAPKGRTVSIAVAAVEKPMTTGWSAAYDLANLSKVVDYIIVMAYDQHSKESAPGPVAGLDWVKRQLDYMTTLVPKNKLVLGVPFYGRVWTNGQNGGGIWYNDSIKAIKENKAVAQWHNQYQVPYAKYTKPDGSTKEIWFENARSLEEKIKLVESYGLKGVAAWRLGQEDPSIWKGFSTLLKGKYFRDIRGHWAENDISYLSSRSLISGRDTYNYAPDAGVTRGEAVAILSRIFNWSSAPKNPFSDVPNNHWAKEPILKAYNHSIIHGVSSNKFGPEQRLTRAQLAVILQRAFRIEETNNQNKNKFQDVPQNHWAAKEIYILSNKGFIAGQSAKKFAPDIYVTRAELAAMIARMIK
ncbi:MAG: glycosyl hydrolase family 18 protein [Bacillota bacterium]